MGNYTLTGIKTSLHEITSDVSGIVLHKTKIIEREYTKNMALTGGMRLMQSNKLSECMADVIHSNLDARLFGYITSNTNNYGVVKFKGRSKVLGINDLAHIFSVTRKKVSEFINKCIKADLIKKDKRKLVVSPYVVSPINIGNSQLFILQTYWDSDFTYDITEEVAAAAIEYTNYKQSNTPKDSV